MEETPQQSETKCKNELQLFTGKYQINNALKDTIEISFISDNCPEDNSNNYLVRGLGQAIDLYTSGETDNSDHTIRSNEIVKQANTLDNEFKFILQSTQLVLQSPKLNVPQITFKKL